MFEGHCHCRALLWKHDRTLDSATACNCTACRRHGALWAYGWEGEDVSTLGKSVVYSRDVSIGLHLCPT